MRKINKIIIHCSDSEWGDIKEIRRWHLEPPMNYDDIGYHFVVLNCYPTYESWDKGQPIPNKDGRIETGRPIEIKGAHVKGHNFDSIGICLIGKKVFSLPQITFLRRKIEELRQVYGDLTVHGHYEFDDKKTCPNLDMEYLRDQRYI